ncbi:MAG: hypothetical protein ACLVML_09065 [Candidatus Gastranaerophilaceae bacterium]|jgi:hypothetical protein|nr:hypothetical protein [Christensenellales bacterium]
MRQYDVLTLVKAETNTGRAGFPETAEVGRREVYVEVMSVKRSEYWQAYAAGICADIMFCLRSADYDGETQVIYNDMPYKVVRSYSTGEYVELTCTKR